jgi:hypothetical protein
MKFILYNYVSAKVVFSIEENDVHYKKKKRNFAGGFNLRRFFRRSF